MDLTHDELLDRATKYAQRWGLHLQDRLGYGVHGSVFLTNRQSAIKVHERESAYSRKRDVYLRLKVQHVNEILGCRVPQLLHYDDELLVIEMSTVSRPFVLDFAGAYLDRAPDHSEEVLTEWRAAKQEQFGLDWPQVELVLAALERYGIYLSDVSPSNISFRAES